MEPKYIFCDNPNVLATDGDFTTSSLGGAVYYVIDKPYVTLRINNNDFDNVDLAELIEFLQSVQQHLRK